MFPTYPEVCWYKDGKVLDEDERYTFHFEDNGEIVFMIDQVSAEDEGYYTCMLKNDFGVSHCEAPLTIDGKRKKMYIYQLFCDSPVYISTVLCES